MENKRKIILEIAEKIISKKGFSETSIEEIAKKAHIGKGTFYLYFKNKEDMFFSIIKESFEELLIKTKKEAEKTENIFEKLKSFIKIYLDYHEKNYYIFKILLQEKPILKKMTFEKLWKEFYDKLGFLKEVIEKGIQEKKIKKYNVEDIIFALIGILNAFVHRWIIYGRKSSLQEKVDTLFRIFINGIKETE